VDPQLWDKLEERIIPFPEKGFMPGSYLRRSYTYATRIGEKLKEEEPVDFIYAQGFCGWTLIDEKRRGKEHPFIGVNFHGLEMFQKAEGLKQRLIQHYFQGPVKFNLEHADVAYSLGARLTDLLKEVAPKATFSEIPIGLDSAWIRENKRPEIVFEGKKKLVFIGRAEHRKGLHLLFEILAQHAFEELEFHFIGAVSKPKAQMKASIEFHGEIREEEKIKKILDDSHALIIPSLSEGMPTVILEAMARGLAVIASDVGAVNELVDGSNGILIPAGDITAIKAALESCSAWTELDWRTRGEASRVRLQNSFTWEKVILRTLQDMQERIH